MKRGGRGKIRRYEEMKYWSDGGRCAVAEKEHGWGVLLHCNHTQGANFTYFSRFIRESRKKSNFEAPGEALGDAGGSNWLLL